MKTDLIGMVFAETSGWIDIIELKDRKRSSKASEQPRPLSAAVGVTIRAEVSPDRVGLDHLSFGVPSRADLEQAAALFDEHGVTHGVITPLPSFGIDVLSFQDPDGIQLELTAPAADQA